MVFLASLMPFSMASGDFVGLAEAEADPAGPVADDDERAEAALAAALGGLGNGLDLDDRLLELLSFPWPLIDLSVFRPTSVNLLD